jgi:hypothetical protein
MNAVVKLTGYDKATEWLETALSLPEGVVGFARTVAGVPDTDPAVLAVCPLTPAQAQEIAARADVELETDRFDYCLEAIAEDGVSRAHTV